MPQPKNKGVPPLLSITQTCPCALSPASQDKVVAQAVPPLGMPQAGGSALMLAACDARPGIQQRIPISAAIRYVPSPRSSVIRGPGVLTSTPLDPGLRPAGMTVKVAYFKSLIGAPLPGRRWSFHRRAVPKARGLPPAALRAGSRACPAPGTGCGVPADKQNSSGRRKPRRRTLKRGERYCVSPSSPMGIQA